MTASVRTLAAAFVIALSGACAPAATHVETLTPGDQPAPVRDASTLRARCANVGSAKRMECYNGSLLATMRADGVSAAMNVLDGLSNMDVDVKRDGHMYAHSIGLAAYTGADKLSSTFRQCLPIFQSGCYHGVIQAYFSEVAGSAGMNGITDDAVNNLCKDYRGTPEGDWLLFQCVHGMGHGLAQVSGHDLKKTLSGCDKLESPWEQEGCYGGAFMENVMEATAPHAAVGRPAGEMDHSSMAGMDHGSAAAAGVKLIDPADPLYPCSALVDRYQYSCYMMQTSVMLHLNHGNIADAATTCDKVSESYRSVCYQSLGRDVSSYTLQDFGKAAALCSNGDVKYQPWCHVGFVKNVIDVHADHTKGVEYCRVLTGSDAKTACYRAVGEQITMLMTDDAKRAAACGVVETAYRETCLIGARVPGPGRPQ